VQDKTAEQTQMLTNRLQKRFRHLKKWAQRTGVGVFRLYDRDIPEIPLVLDYYGDCARSQDAALCGALYKRPYEKDENDEQLWLSAMKDAVSTALEIKPENIFIKQRQRQRGVSQYEKTGQAHFEKIITEGGLSFKVNLSDYLDTGLFIDRRLLRVMIRSESAGKKVLNLFSYTGSFSVYAASGAAVSTDSIDLSNTYLNWAHDNFSLNGISASMLRTWDFFDNKEKMCAHNIVRADVLEFLEKAIKAKKRWDIIVLDPPAFSNSKKMYNDFDLNRDITGLLNQCLKLLTPGGKIFLSVNLRRNAPSAEELEASLANVRVTDISGKITDEDFKGRKVPKAFLIN
jgi:23S rRNA G2069 N7-methylase RlmK/C1962 C5-methylase RlmI